MTNLKQTLIGISLSAMTLLLASQSWAISLTFNPSSTEMDIGGSVNLDIVISDLQNDNVAAFDFNLNYDSSILSFDSYILGDGLGDVDAGDAMDLSLGDNLAEISWLWDFSFQQDSFTLATITFSAISAGTSGISISNLTLSDDGWPAQSLAATLGTGEITVNSAPVPEPGTMLLFGTGIAGLASRRLRKKK